MGVVGAVLFLFIIYFYFEMVRLLLVYLGLMPNEYTSDIYLTNNSTIGDLPPNIKSKTTTKMRWARRTHDNNSFADAVIWGDLGND